MLRLNIFHRPGGAGAPIAPLATPMTRNEEKRGSTVIDGKFAELSCHTEPTLPSANRHDCVQILEETILLENELLE